MEPPTIGALAIPNRIVIAAMCQYSAVGPIAEPGHAEAIMGNGDADTIGIARTILHDARGPWHAAAALRAKVIPPNQCRRCR